MSMTLSLQRHAKRILAYSNRPRFFCSYRNGTLSTNQTLHGRIEAALDQKAEITARLHQALEVSDWMIEHKICCLVPEDFSARFQLIENVLGLEEAEKYFESIPENLRGESLYTALLRSYAKRSEKKYLDRASRIHIQEDERISSFGTRDKVDESLREMKESNIDLDRLTVNKALRVYAAASDVAAMERFLADWEGTVKLDLMISTEQRRYTNEWQCSRLEFDVRMPIMLVSAYREKGMVEKAEKLMTRWGLKYRLCSKACIGDKAMKLVLEMKENKIEPDSVTINNVLRVNAYGLALESMEKFKSKWDGDGKTKLDAMAAAYERAGLLLKAIEIQRSKKEVYRLWNEYKNKANDGIARE
ncbi:unnamed protein product [Arabidopsis thaliana]|uniref:Uncharacterized protein n=3 Tax=Arabidopsis TaxID=3701 RepID=A0A654F630_ARATH|nr:Pentatricopeptide repeat (PPR) superfamily protein [Arabidopsis thaliana]KAG7630835.1 hypothetical protein ISN44_As03g011190 [Arabidopsis suecica]AAG51431.1 hypothetical protein; 1030-2613 [Arabidopsis thaliana]AEE75033.1 Pentatricopeptide repeat (PPR) superfamily protein [Arabidopsis thaliana]CAA0382051.1 unnamed protein product [Arabidopsis thaliana]VYS57004.1 unnamed protein product [Arabidopsis thaliana]|eukprot:NP_187743.1 Pentatricopeptide repeat (PPR) superfamily protein [Arabidopsis thaliana]